MDGKTRKKHVLKFRPRNPNLQDKFQSQKIVQKSQVNKQGRKSIYLKASSTELSLTKNEKE